MDTPVTSTTTLSPLQSQRVLLPDHQSPRTKALTFCKRIDHVEVRESVKLNGHTYFIVHVFYKKPQSNIPTLQRRQSQTQAASRVSPDVVVYHRFSQFVNLRHEAYFHTSNGHTKSRSCSYCTAIMQLLYDGPTVPRLHMKLFHSNGSMGMALEAFLNSLLELTRTLATCLLTRTCEGQHEIPLLLEKFLTTPTNDDQSTEPTHDSQRGVSKASTCDV